MKYISATLVMSLLMLGSLFMMPTAARAATCADKPPIEIGWVAWAENEFEAKLVKQLLEDHFGCKVKLTLTNIGVEYEAVAKGDLDLMVEAWFPDTHRAYWEKVGTKVWDLGPLFLDARNGWVVPDYVPKSQLSSIEDLKKPEVAEKLGHEIQGIDPGAGLMQLSSKTIKAYGLNDYKLVSASGAGMTASLARAIQHHKWIVVTGWTPHWMFGRWHLRFLEDPKGTLGGPQHSDKIMRQGFYQEYPQVTAMLARMQIPLDMLQKAMYGAEKTSYKQAVQEFIDNNPKLIDYWVKGVPALGDSK